MDQIGDGIRKILKAGIGAVETAVEKSGEVIDQLAEKGSETYNQVVHKGGEIVDRIKKSFAECDMAELLDKPETLTEIEQALGKMSKQALQKLRAVLDRAEQAVDARENADACKCDDACGCGQGAPNDACCCDDPNCCNDPISQCDGNDAEKNENEGNG